MRRRWVLTGRVQGVGFRAWTAHQAESLGLAGWVRNLPDGGVEAEAEGDADAVAQFERLLKEGPPHATVREISVVTCGDDVLPRRFSVLRS